MSQTFFLLSSIQALQSPPVSSWTDDQRNTYTEKKNALFFAVLYQTLHSSTDLLQRIALVPGCANESGMCGSACFLPPAWTLFFCLLIKSWSTLESHMQGWFQCIFTGSHPCLMWQRTSITCTTRQLSTPAVWGVRQTQEVLLFVPYLKQDGTLLGLFWIDWSVLWRKKRKKKTPPSLFFLISTLPFQLLKVNASASVQFWRLNKEKLVI